MTDKKQIITKQKPVHTIRCGEVTVAIFHRQSNAGYAYYDFSLGRSWRSASSGKEAHGCTFFEKNEQDLIEAIREASVWLRERNHPPAPGPAANKASDNSR